MTKDPAVLRLWERRSVFGPFAMTGAGSVLAGGVLAAIIAAPAPTRHGVWAVAYLVLVLGASQIVLGAGVTSLAAAPPTARMVAITATAFNIANIAILAGIVAGHLVMFDAGALVLIAALVLFLNGVRKSDRHGWQLYAYRLFVGVLIVSIPFGMFAHTLGPA